jgi:DNA-directed RNA polymerase subunit RPC12/RpoP
MFDSVGTRPTGGSIPSGSMPGEGTYFCVLCGWQAALRETDELPNCGYCGSAHFRRDSIFSPLQEHGSPTLEFALTPEGLAPSWLEEARERLAEPGYHLAMREEGEIVTFPLRVGWSKIGRCETAQICLDDPSVSRRHAVIATDGQRPPRILDDRSLNGLLVNGGKTDFAELQDGDELTIGRYRLYLLHA